MTYGHWLDQATGALRAASDAAAGAGADGHASVAAAVAARTRAYEQLVRLVNHLGGPIVDEVSVPIADRLVNSGRRLGAASGGRLLGVGLRAASVDLAAPTSAVTPPEAGLVAAHLAAAADNLGIAADLLAGHLGRPNGRPRTPEGQAIAAGTGHHGATADVARLATELIETDRRLLGWLARSTPARTLRPVYAPVARRLRWWTHSPYPRLLRRIADSPTGESVLRLLEPAPATERSTGPHPVASLRDVLDTLDTTRAWLQQHPQQAHLAHARAAARLAVTIAHGIPGGRTGGRANARRWEQIASKLHDLTELGDARSDHLLHELVAAQGWLHHQLGAHQAADSTAGDPNWRDAVSTLQGRLPALAEQIDRYISAATTRGQLCVPQAELDLTTTRRGIYYAKAGWRRATPTDDPIQTLRSALYRAAQVPADREKALRQALGNPAAIARLASAQPPIPTGTGRSTEPPVQCVTASEHAPARSTDRRVRRRG